MPIPLPQQGQAREYTFPKEGLRLVWNGEGNIAGKTVVHLQDLITDKSMLKNLSSSVHL